MCKVEYILIGKSYVLIKYSYILYLEIKKNDCCLLFCFIFAISIIKQN